MKARISVLVCVVVVGMTILSGCATTAQVAAPEVQTEETQGPQFETMSPVVSSEGSLWTDTGSIRLFSDMRAREVGDLVTVRISEKPTGKYTPRRKQAVIRALRQVSQTLWVT